MRGHEQARRVIQAVLAEQLVTKMAAEKLQKRVAVDDRVGGVVQVQYRQGDQLRIREEGFVLIRLSQTTTTGSSVGWAKRSVPNEPPRCWARFALPNLRRHAAKSRA
ncbi:MAG: hypothetical protein Q8Q28_12940, partial [Pseudomonadota bacterium]|nr:hypothetical protein [Pseudomonadota bacterium]